MSKIYFTNDLEQDAVPQIVERGHSADEVSKRMRVSQHSLYEWKKKFSGARYAAEYNDDAAFRLIKRELARVT